MVKRRKRRSLKQVFLDELKKQSGGKQTLIGNISLRDSLSWEAKKYDRIKWQLYDENLIITGRGHGGTVSLADAPGSKALSLFISYSHQDEKLKQTLQNHLVPLKRLNLVETWSDRKLKPGDEWDKSISRKLEKADIVLLLVSIDFINSDYCYDIELEKALDLHEEGKAVVIPVLLRACMWKHTLFSKLQALPRDAKPVTSWSDQDEAFTEVAEGVRQVALRLLDDR